MRVYARATATHSTSAVGQLELCCTPSGLELTMGQVFPFTQGYAPGAVASGARVVVPWSELRGARVGQEDVYIEFASPSFPHERITLSEFTAGPGVPPHELRQRRLILHLSALGLAFSAVLVAATMGPKAPSGSAAYGSLGYGALVALLVLGAGYSLDQRFFLRPPSETETRRAFVSDLRLYFPLTTDAEAEAPPPEPFEWPNFGRLLPRTVVLAGVVLAGVVLTTLATSRRLLDEEERIALRDDSPLAAEPELGPEKPVLKSSSAPSPVAPKETKTATEDEGTPHQEPTSGEALVPERRCLCDRADSPLWRKPIPRLSTLLLEKRTLQTKTSVRTTVEVAVINNGDAPVDDITLLVNFSEKVGGKLAPTKERPLYFEGPLRPGEAIKWTTEARGTHVEVASPDVGNLGTSGEGAAPGDAFFALMSAKSRPVRLHAARMLAYLGDPRAEDAALTLKDALRSAEAPYLRRILSALGATRVCDVQIDVSPAAVSVGVCVFNASEEKREGLGVELQALSGTLDVSQPLANPPELRAQKKWPVPGSIDAQTGAYVRIPLPSGFLSEPGSALEIVADRYDLLD